MANSRTPASTRAKAIAEPAPPAPTSKARIPSGLQPLAWMASVKADPSNMSPNQPPSGARRMILTAPMNCARSLAAAHNS